MYTAGVVTPRQDLPFYKQVARIMAASETRSDGDRPREALASAGTPMPTARFRRRAWLAFQRAIDPLARPKPLQLKRPH